MRSWLTNPPYLGRISTRFPILGASGTIQFFIDSGSGYALRTTGSDPPVYMGIGIISDVPSTPLFGGRFPSFGDSVTLPTDRIVSGDSVSTNLYSGTFPTGSESATLTNNVASDSVSYTLT